MIEIWGGSMFATTAPVPRTVTDAILEEPRVKLRFRGLGPSSLSTRSSQVHAACGLNTLGSPELVSRSPGMMHKKKMIEHFQCE
jgi:hypothetical protein